MSSVLVIHQAPSPVARGRVDSGPEFSDTRQQETNLLLKGEVITMGRRQNFRKLLLQLAVVTGLSALVVGSARGDVIDFEGLSDGLSVGTIVTGTNAVTFEVDPNTTPMGAVTEGTIVEVGAPVTGFVPADTPAAAVADQFFLSDLDELPLSNANNFFMTFLKPVRNLSLDLYDYRSGENSGPVVGSTATLELFSDSFITSLGTDTFTILGTEVDGNVVNLSVTGILLEAVAASLVLNNLDVGVGIDNLEFTTVPEASTLLLLGSGLAGLWAAAWTRRRRN